MEHEYRVTITPEAQAQIRGITDRRDAKQVVDRIRDLRNQPDQQGKPLWNELAGCRSIRVAAGRYRVIYRVAQVAREVTIVVVGIRREGSRSDVYRLAAQMVRRGLI